jgi:hypothetical protein
MISSAAPADTGSIRADRLIDEQIDPFLSEFRELLVWDEHGRRSANDPLLLNFTYHPWNEAFSPEVFDQNNTAVDPSDVTVDYEEGTISVDGDPGNFDYFVTYQMNLFPAEMLYGLMQLTLAEINASASDPSSFVTSFSDIDSAPLYFEGPLVVGTLAKAFKKLALDGMLWKNFLIWQNGDAAQQLASAASSEFSSLYAELRIGSKRGKYIARPTEIYDVFRSTGFGGINSFAGKWRGFQVNKIGVTVPLSGSP